MGEKVLLVLVDGMRPDSLAGCGHPLIEEMKTTASYTLEATTVMPSVTLPCHMSLFHSVVPERHGILQNLYTPQVRPIAGLFEQLHANDKVCAMFYSWEPLRDVSRPGSLAYSCLISGGAYTYEVSNEQLTDRAISYIQEEKPDVTFLYLGLVDEIGHKHGWMSEEYLQAVHASWASIERAVRALPEDYAVIITSDHGGHDRMHGTNMPEDMKIPLFIKSPSFLPGGQIRQANIIDIAPTVAKLTGIPSNSDWEGQCLQ